MEYASWYKREVRRDGSLRDYFEEEGEAYLWAKFVGRLYADSYPVVEREAPGWSVHIRYPFGRLYILYPCPVEEPILEK